MASCNPQDALPPPLQDVPTAKEKRFDRQLRLWGASGQLALENANILLINNGTGVAGVETLKNLVLPGIGQFTIVDATVVSQADLGVNFFLEEESVGKFRADETVRLLGEMNPDVKGLAVKESVEAFVAKDDGFADYSLILVAAPIDPGALKLIQAKTQPLGIPLVYMHCVGFYSHFSIALPSAFPIVDTHPDVTATTDLRVLRPWPALTAFAKDMTKGLDQKSALEKGHIPYVCLLLHYLELWKNDNDGKVPETYKEKQKFRDDYVRKGSFEEENFDEAVAAVLKSLNPPTPSSAVREILSAPETTNLKSNSPPFWIISKAIDRFYSQHGVLPLPGAVPDMKAQSADYVCLQRIYKTKAREDCAEVEAFVREIEKETGRSSKSKIDAKEIENFCKGASHIHLVRGRPLQIVEPGTPVSFGDRANALASELTNPESLMGLYITFLAWDKLTSTDKTSTEARTPDSTTSLTTLARTILDDLLTASNSPLPSPEYEQIQSSLRRTCVEMARADGAELHNVASLTGGMVAQEVIKVITGQYVPVDNTCVFDGVGSRCWVFRV